VKFAFQSGGTTTLADFFSNAGKSVENGLSRDAAIRSMTLGTAEILGVADRLGSIETGKIANLALVKGDLFGKDRFVSNVFVDGRPFEQKLPSEKPATGRPAGAAPAGLAQVGGNYSITVEIPGQQLTGTLALTQQGAVLTGSFQTQLGTATIKDGVVTPEGFSFASTVEFAGTQIEIHVKGAVTGNQIKGTFDSPQGTVPFTGTRNP
jgi:adenine deaminase